MAKEWILNSVMNRFQLNYKKNVGAVSEEIRKKFTAKYGGKVFYVISIKQGDKKRIQNSEVIEEIRKEIERLSNE